MARSPDRLREILLADHKVPKNVIDQLLFIHQGDVKDPAAVGKVLINPRNKNLLVDVILSGVGVYPNFQWSIRQPLLLPDPTICETAIRTIFSALSNLAADSQLSLNHPMKKPLLVVVSTAGCGRARGIPLPIYHLYHYLLSSPLTDKKRMEELILTEGNAQIRDFAIIRPLFLTDAAARGDDCLKIGWEWGVIKTGEQTTKEPGPALGYYVSRRDVGGWMFNHLVAEGGWEGKCIYLAYK